MNLLKGDYRSGLTGGAQGVGSVQGELAPFLWVAAGFSVAVNLLMLVAPLYMLQVYDRVLVSGSTETLIMLSAIAVGLLLIYGFAEAARRKIMVLLADFVQTRHAGTIARTSFAGTDTAKTLPARLGDLSMVQSVIQNGLLLPLFDLPFTPVFILAMFLVHPVIGMLGIIGVLVLAGMTAITELWSRQSLAKSQGMEREAQSFADQLSRNRAAIIAQGMLDRMLERWGEKKARASQMTRQGSGAPNFFGAQARSLRQVLQIAALGAGAFLVLDQQLSAGAIVAGSILLGRALAPIDQILGGWRQLVRAKLSWQALEPVRAAARQRDIKPTAMPRPSAQLQVESLAVASPGSDRPLFPKFNLSLEAGSMTVVLGPSGSGKTSLLQTLSGVWPAMEGMVRLGGRDMHSWDSSDRGRYVGYAPQDAELLPGTVSENIARFEECGSETIVQTAQSASFHDTLLRLPEGYDTQIGRPGSYLSRGQKQAISLTRAMYGDSVLLCLDEPTANLDHHSVAGFKRALAAAKDKGQIIIVSTHDLGLIELCDHVIWLSPTAIKMVSGAEYLETLKTHNGDRYYAMSLRKTREAPS